MMAVANQAISHHRPPGPEKPAPLLPKLTPQLQHFPKGANDHPGVAARWLSGLARVVMHAHLGDGCAKLPRAREYLDVDQRPGAAKLGKQAFEDIAAIELEPAIDV